MKLDVAGRFVLQAKSPGYRLTIDGKTVVFCHSPGAALSYVAETLMSDVDGDVALALYAVEQKLDYARRVLDLDEAVKTVCRALARADREGGDRRARVAAAALELSGLPNIDVFRKSNQAQEIANLAKVIIDTWSEGHDQRRKEAAVRSPAAKLDQDL